MNNSLQFIFISFFTISFFCKGMHQLNDQQKIRTKMLSPQYIEYIGDKDILIAGLEGLEIHRVNQQENVKHNFLWNFWRPLQDKGNVIWSNGRNDILYFDANRNTTKHFTSIDGYRIVCGDFDSMKNTIFFGCNNGKHGIIRKHKYPSTECESLSLNKDIYCCALTLNPKKDILFLLDSAKNISLRDPNNIPTILKIITLPFETPVWCESYLKPLAMKPSLIGSRIAVGNENEFCIIDYDAPKNNIKHHLKEFSHGGKFPILVAIAFNPMGFFATLNREYINDNENKSFIDYWDIETAKKIDTQCFENNILWDLCFRGDGREVAVAGTSHCFTMSVDSVIKKHLLPLWMALKQIEKSNYLTKDIIKHCMYIFLNFTHEK